MHAFVVEKYVWKTPDIADNPVSTKQEEDNRKYAEVAKPLLFRFVEKTDNQR